MQSTVVDHVWMWPREVGQLSRGGMYIISGRVRMPIGVHGGIDDAQCA